jgi:4-carboxymuconolactone decarboxylase
MPAEPSPAKQLIGDTAPKLVELTDDVLFGDVWLRPELSPRDRSLITVSALVANYRLEQLPGHLRRALANGVTQEELAEAAFYAGWPCAITPSCHRRGGRTGEISCAEEELAEAITHLAFYAGWPCAMSAITILKTIVEESGEAK